MEEYQKKMIEEHRKAAKMKRAEREREKRKIRQKMREDEEDGDPSDSSELAAAAASGSADSQANPASLAQLQMLLPGADPTLFAALGLQPQNNAAVPMMANTPTIEPLPGMMPAPQLGMGGFFPPLVGQSNFAGGLPGAQPPQQKFGGNSLLAQQIILAEFLRQQQQMQQMQALNPFAAQMAATPFVPGAGFAGGAPPGPPPLGSGFNTNQLMQQLPQQMQQQPLFNLGPPTDNQQDGNGPGGEN